MFGVGDFAKKIAEPAKQTAAKKLMPAPSFLFLMGVAFINDYGSCGLTTKRTAIPEPTAPTAVGSGDLGHGFIILV
jgi:hypothetical protein